MHLVVHNGQIIRGWISVNDVGVIWEKTGIPAARFVSWIPDNPLQVTSGKVF